MDQWTLAGIEDALIQVLGRWQSTAHLCYIKIPQDQQASSVYSPHVISCKELVMQCE